MTSSVQVAIFIGRVLLYLPFLVVAGSFPLLIEQWGVSATQAGSIVSAFYFSYAFSLFAFSWLCDWWGAKRVAAISIAATAVTSAAFAFWAIDYWSTVVTYALIGASHGGIYTPLVILLRQNVASDKLGTAVGWLIASTSAGYAFSIGVTGLCIYMSGCLEALRLRLNVQCGLEPCFELLPKRRARLRRQGTAQVPQPGTPVANRTNRYISP